MAQNPRPVPSPPPPAKPSARPAVRVPPSALIVPRALQARLAPVAPMARKALPLPARPGVPLPVRPRVTQTKLATPAVRAGRLPLVPPAALGVRALQRRAKPPSVLAAKPAALIQRHQALPAAKVMTIAPAARPWTGYPYAIVGAEPFNAQAGAHGVGGNDQFLTAVGGGAANVVAALPGGLSLRVSNNNDMAIEETNLTTRQPKTFYATAGIVAASNLALAAINSRVRLHPHAGSITIWTGWWSQQTLVRVTPVYNGGADLLPQNCNAMAARVTGSEAAAFVNNSTALAARTAASIAPVAWRAYREAYVDKRNPFDEEGLLNRMALDYHNALDAHDHVMEAAGANRFAKPNVGQSYMTATMGIGPRNPDGTSRVHDHASGQDRNLGWTYHFAGVVARSGRDRVTLENYARGDNRQDGADPRWYFQMYGEQAGQSFHEVSDAGATFANPVTVTVDAATTALPLFRA